jgi:hypothetical protein
MNTFIIFTGSEGQILTDQIKKDGKPFDLDTSTVDFYLRHATSDQLKVNGADAEILNAETGQVSYEWTDSDLDEPGEYFGWWVVDNPDTTNIDTDEFFVIITKHSPGQRTETGAIYRKARAKIPTTWTALENLDTYGDALLQEQIEVCKLNVYGTSVAVGDEIDSDIRVQDYIAKLAVLYIIPAGIDYWLDQHQTITAQGNPAIEIASYPDRIKALKEIQEQLLAEIAKEKPLIEDILDVPQVISAIGTPATSDGGDWEEGFVTPNPNTHFRDYAFPGRRSDRYSSRSIW